MPSINGGWQGDPEYSPHLYEHVGGHPITLGKVEAVTIGGYTYKVGITTGKSGRFSLTENYYVVCERSGTETNDKSEEIDDLKFVPAEVKKIISRLRRKIREENSKDLSKVSIPHVRHR